MLIRPRATVANLVTWSAACAACLVLFAPVARAQPPGPFPGGPSGPGLPPPFSPFLNLARPNSNPAINYYGIIRPQNQFANSLQALQRQSALGPFAATDTNPDAPVSTGHPFGFQTQYLYYQNQYSLAGYGYGRNTGFGGSGGYGGYGGFGNRGFGTAAGTNTSFGAPGIAPPRKR
jgi:hypothetical protein